MKKTTRKTLLKSLSILAALSPAPFLISCASWSDMSEEKEKPVSKKIPLTKVVKSPEDTTSDPDQPDTGIAPEAPLETEAPHINFTPPANIDDLFINSPNYQAERLKLETFTVTTAKENPYLPNMLSDVDNTERSFLIFDNKLFKVKIDKNLIGLNKAFANEEKAKMLAKDIARKINIGPAIFSLKKGIQILSSQNDNSLGGDVGVQVALKNGFTSYDDANIRSVASLVSHEYGHHETLWDFHNIMNVNGRDVETKVMKEIYSECNYPKLDALMLGKGYSRNLGFKEAGIDSYPNDYNFTPKNIGPQVFDDPNYVFSGPEAMTRTWNMLSLIVEEPRLIYSHNGPVNTMVTSDETYRYYAKDSIFGGGKDNSRVQELYKDMLKKVHGIGKSSFYLEYNPNDHKLTGFHFSSFGSIIPTKFVVKNEKGAIVKTFFTHVANGLFGRKNELFTKTQSVKNVIPFAFIGEDNTPMDFTALDYSIEAYNGQEQLDLSHVTITNSRAHSDVPGMYSQWPSTYLTTSGKSLLITNK